MDHVYVLANLISLGALGVVVRGSYDPKASLHSGGLSEAHYSVH